MALATTISGSGKLVNKNSDVRTWKTAELDGNGDGYQYDYTETTKEEVREWVALTQAAAEDAVDAADQTGLGTGEVASYVASEEDRVIGAYKLTKTITSKTLEVEVTAVTGT